VFDFYDYEPDATDVEDLFGRALDRAADRLNEPDFDALAALNFTANPGPQTTFLSLPDENLDVLYGGAAGGSKSTSLLMYAIRACVRYPGLQAFWFRRTFPELEHSVIRMLGRYGFGAALGARWNATKYELTFPNRSVLTLGHAKNAKEVEALQSAEINLLLIDERTTIPPEVVDLLYVRVRSGVPGVPCLGIRSATNPGGIGHSRVKRDYVEATGHGRRELTDAAGRRRIFIQAKVSDTPQLGDEYKRNLEGLDEKLRKAFLEGDWDAVKGMMFTAWSNARHVVEPFTLPGSWVRYNGIDWGYAAPWAVCWGALDEDGRLWVYREIYATQVGEAEQAQQIAKAEADGESVAVRYADDAMWATRGDAKPISDVYAENGVYLTPAGKGPGSRVAGWQRIRSYLKDGPACPHHRAKGWETCPRLHVFNTCEEFIRTVPALPHATVGDPEDADSHAEDHMPDALRYLCINIGGGPQFPEHDVFVAADEVAGLPILDPLGAFAVHDRRRDDPDWWTTGEDADVPATRITSIGTAPWH
jgi:hypothetical protein